MASFADDTDLEHPLIIHELGRRWIDALRSHTMRLRIQVRHSAGVQDTLRIARAARRGTLVVELGQDPLASLDLLERVAGLSLEIATLVVARSDQDYLEVPAREMGAIAFLKEPLTGSELARIVSSIVRLQLNWCARTGSI
jgi:FixJ family two-component response regulator